MTKARRFKGKHPKDVEPVVTLRDGDGREWMLYRRPEHDASGWQRYKLVAADRALHKANYPLSWSPTESRFADSANSQALDSYRGELFDAVHAYLEFCV